MTIRKLVGTLENKGPYIDASTGHWFYWNSTKYVDSGYPYAVKTVWTAGEDAISKRIKPWGADRWKNTIREQCY